MRDEGFCSVLNGSLILLPIILSTGTFKLPTQIAVLHGSLNLTSKVTQSSVNVTESYL